MEANKKGFKGVWLCAAIYESQELSATEKLLLAEIDALTSDADACYPTNARDVINLMAWEIGDFRRAFVNIAASRKEAARDEIR